MKGFFFFLLFFINFISFSQVENIKKIEFEYSLSHVAFQNLNLTFKINHNKKKVKVLVNNERNFEKKAFNISYDYFIEVLQEIEKLDKNDFDSEPTEYRCLDGETSRIKIFNKKQASYEYSFYCLLNTETNENRKLYLKLCESLIQSALINSKEYY